MPWRRRIDEQIVGSVFLVAAGSSWIVNNDANLLRAGGNANVKIYAKAVSACHLNGATAIVAGVFRGVIEGVDRPAAIVAVRAKIMDANVARGNRGIRRLGLERYWRCEQQKGN